MSPGSATAAPHHFSGRLFKTRRYVWLRLLSNCYFYPGFWSVRFSVCPLRVSLYFPQSFGAPEIKPNWSSRSNALGNTFWVQDPQAGEPNMGLRTLTALENHCNIIILQFVGHPPRVMGLDYIASLPLLPVSLWFVLYVFSYRRSFLVGSVLFH